MVYWASKNDKINKNQNQINRRLDSPLKGAVHPWRQFAKINVRSLQIYPLCQQNAQRNTYSIREKARFQKAIYQLLCLAPDLQID